MSMPQTRKPGRTHRRAVLLLPLLLPYTSGAWAGLSLAAAERLALEADPAVIASQSRALALQEQAVADGQLPDPKLTVGVWNVPLDDFSMKKEGSSQFRSGIKQAFPRGQTLHYRQKHTEWLGRAEQAQTKFAEQEIRRDVRQTFLELYYQIRATQVIDRSRKLFKQLVDIARAHYASGRVSQQDVLQAQLELSRLEDRATKIGAQSDVQRASLSRWIGEAAWQPVDPGFPVLPDLQSQATLKASLVQHPTIESATAFSLFSIRVTFSPNWEATLATTRPPAPPPIITRSLLFIDPSPPQHDTLFEHFVSRRFLVFIAYPGACWYRQAFRRHPIPGKYAWVG